MAGIGETGATTPTTSTPRTGRTGGTDPAADTPAPDAPANAAPAPARDQANVPDVTKNQAKPAHIDIEKVDIDQQVKELVKQSDHEGVVGQAVEFWHDMRKQDGAAGYVGAAMETLLEFSGLPAVERDSAELGARVGLGDSNTNIAKTAGKLAFDSGMVVLNGVAAGGALSSAGKAAKAAMAGEALVDTAATGANIVRHYTTAEKAMQIMESGEIWASKSGMAGGNKVYLLAENAGERGMNFLRQMNIGVAKTGKAIEIDLAKLPPEVAAKFQQEGFRGFLNQENFVTHSGMFDFKAFRDAVKVVDTEKLAVTFDQVLKAGGRLAGFGGFGVDVGRGAKGAADTAQ